MSLWNFICSRLRPSEISEVERIIGVDTIDRNKEVAEEIENLQLLQEDIKPMPNIFRHSEKVTFYLSQLAQKSEELGIPINDREQRIIDTLSEAPSTRPQSASTVPRIKLPQELDIFIVEELKSSLIEALDEEYEMLRAQAEELQNSLVYQVSGPTPNEVKNFAKKLENAYLHEPVFHKKEPSRKLEPILREEPDFEFELNIKKPLDVCVPKIKTIVKPYIQPKLDDDDQLQHERPPTKGRVSRRLRNMVDDFRKHNLS